MNTRDIEQVIIALGQDAIPDLEGKLAGECARSGISVTDIVGNSYAYVVVGVLNGNVPVPKTGTDLYRMMAAKANHLIKDAKRSLMTDHGRRSIRTNESIDQVIGECEREMVEYASYEDWQNARRAEERAHQYMICRKVLDKVCEMRKISSVNQCIYKAVVLHEMPREEVAAHYGTSRNNVDQIISRVKKGLKEDGLWIYRELYNEAA